MTEPGEICLIYVSRGLVAGPVRDEAVADLVAVSLARNARLDVTGALMWTGAFFAQLLEGPEPAVETLMDSIRRDPRHHDIHVVTLEPLPRRRFAPWRMAYCGAASYLDAILAPLFEVTPQAPDPPRSDKLVRLLHAFAQDARG